MGEQHRAGKEEELGSSRKNKLKAAKQQKDYLTGESAAHLELEENTLGRSTRLREREFLAGRTNLLRGCSQAGIKGLF